MSRIMTALCTLLMSWPSVAGRAIAQDRPPNFVIVFADDLGYADIGPFGAEAPTPHLDGMAAEGRKFTNFYVAQAVCSASRAGLLTGCYPNRIGILGALGPRAKHGIHADEWTIAEVLKTRGYATGIFGKWHLGDEPRFLPIRHGFDEYFGLPYSNDMWPQHPTAKFPDLPLIEGDRVVNPRVTAEDQKQLTTWYTERAVDFIDRHRDEPFFLYVPHSMPHVPIFASEKHEGKSGHGLYGDVIMEIDWSVGQILEALERNGLDENTMVIFTSDNGPWLSYGDHAGSAGPLREGKGTTWEGGHREPTVMRWPGKIPAGTVCDEPAMTIDILPTLAALAGIEKLPQPHPIDGLNIWPLIAGELGAETPHAAFYFYWGNELQAVRGGRWKLHFPHSYRSLQEPGHGGQPGEYVQKKTELALYDLAADVGERTNVAEEHPEVVERLKRLADAARRDLGDSATKSQGKNTRPPGRL